METLAIPNLSVIFCCFSVLRSSQEKLKLPSFCRTILVVGSISKVFYRFFWKEFGKYEDVAAIIMIGIYTGWSPTVLFGSAELDLA